MKNNGNISLRFSDIFNTRVFAGEDYGVNFVKSYRFKPVSRMAYVTFTYNFRKGQDVNKRNLKSRDNKSDVVD